MAESTKGYVVHNVLFWLKNPDSQAELDKIAYGLHSLKDIPGIVAVHVGVPLTKDEVGHIENGYDVGALIVFDNVESSKAYSPHPIHEKFVADCGDLYGRVLVIDSVNVI
jgi:hypothetical protein